jgi:hypothetical protein
MDALSTASRVKRDSGRSPASDTVDTARCSSCSSARVHSGGILRPAVLADKYQDQSRVQLSQTAVIMLCDSLHTVANRQKSHINCIEAQSAVTGWCIMEGGNDDISWVVMWEHVQDAR